jgi:hypothetical protein
MEIDMHQQAQHPAAQPAADTARRLHAAELTEVGATLTEEEMSLVAGARMTVSWTCGSLGKADEWTV